MIFINNCFCFAFVVYFVASSLSIFLKSIIKVVTNLNPLNLVNKSFSLFLIANSVFLSRSSRLKQFKIFTLQVLA